MEGDVFRNVRMTPELMDQLFTRNEQGYRLRVDWGEPDTEGFYLPSITTDYTDRLFCDCHARVSDGLPCMPEPV